MPQCVLIVDLISIHIEKKEEEKAHAEALRNQAIEAERQRKYDLSLWPNKLYLMAPWPVKPLFRPLVFAGRAPRIEFWSYLAFYVLSVVFGLIVLACMNMTSGTWFVGVYIIYGFVCLFSCFIRRYHDAIHVNYSPITGLVALICLAIPGIGWIVALWLCEVLNPSQEGSNKYGANPFTYYHTRNLGYCCAKSNIGNEMNRSVNSNNVPYEFEWRRLATAEKIQAAHKMCMRYAKYANYYNSAPVGAKEYISLVFYVTVYPEALDENSYVRQSEEVIRHLNEEDLEYLIRHEADSQMHKVFTTRLSDIRRLNNIGMDSQKDVSRQKGKSFRVALKWLGVCAIVAIILSVLWLIITVITAHKGKEKSDLEVQYERLLMLENKYGTNSVEYIEARIDLIRKYTLNINKELVDRHRNFMFVLNKAGYTVCSEG